MSSPQNRILFVSCLLLVIASFALFQPILTFLIHEDVDYATHLSYLQPTMDSAAVGRLLSMFPHILYHLSVYTVYKVLSPPTIADAGLIVSLVAYILGSLATFWLMVRILGKPGSYRAGIVYIGITLALMVLMPIDIFTPDNLFVGYIAINAYHNPTIVLLKPAAILMYWCTCQIFQVNDKVRRNVPIWACALATVLCIMAKPSYAIALLPAVMVLAGIQAIQRRRVDWVLLIWGFIIPGYVALALQIVLFQGSTGFMFAPLAAINSWTRINPDAPNGWPLKFLLSILFPLLVYVLYFKQATKNLYLNLAWVSFGFGAAYLYLLAEGGERLSHVNFVWSAICALYILFIVSTCFFIQQVRAAMISTTSPENNTTQVKRWTLTRRSTWAIVICISVFGLHVISGLYWYSLHLTATSMGDIIANRW